VAHDALCKSAWPKPGSDAIFLCCRIPESAHRAEPLEQRLLPAGPTPGICESSDWTVRRERSVRL
jgi:hypothetical protein